MPSDSRVDIALLYPGLLGTYGDRGNAFVLAKRLQWRGIDADVLTIEVGEQIPATADVYVFGGGEDSAQILAQEHLSASPGWRSVANNDTPVLAVCAGLQILGTAFRTSDGVTHEGIGMIDVTTEPGQQRAVGEIAASARGMDGVDLLTGFENHLGRSTLGPSAWPLAEVVSGIGNDERVEGAVQGHLIATYLHGPVLARNPDLADLILRWTTGSDLPPLEVEPVTALRRKYLGKQLDRQGTAATT